MDNSIDKEEKEERAAKRKRVGTITREEWETNTTLVNLSKMSRERSGREILPS